MAPPAADVDVPPSTLEHVPIVKNAAIAPNRNGLDGPLSYSGSLDQYRSVEVTNVIGREYPELQVSEILNDDSKIRDLAIIGLCQMPIPYK